MKSLKERQEEWDREYDSHDSEPVKSRPSRPSEEGDRWLEDVQKPQHNSNTLLGYLETMSLKTKGSKALRLWNKCMLHGHPKVALAIEEKYGAYFPKDDMIIALGMAMVAAKQVGNE